MSVKHKVIGLTEVVLFFALCNFLYAQAPTWTQLTPKTHTGLKRYFHTSVYDTTSNRMTVFGGYDNGSALDDLWILTDVNGLSGATTWTQMTVTGNLPPPRDLHSAVYDGTNNLMVVFGGSTDGSITGVNDVWVLSGANGLSTTTTWTQIFPVGTKPSGRFSHSAVYDETNNRMIIFGGSDTTGVLNETWVLVNANGLGGTPFWIQLTTGINIPNPRWYHCAIYDATNNRMTIFGGSSPLIGYQNDAWVLTNANGLGGTPLWSLLTANPDPLNGVPTQRDVRNAGVYDPANNRMTIFGGGGPLNDVWVLGNANGLGGVPYWNTLYPVGIPPESRAGRTAVYDVANNRLLIFAGTDDGTPLNDTWLLTDADSLLPSLTNLPSLKLFSFQSFNPAFDLSDYNNGLFSDSYSIVSSFLGLSIVSASVVYQEAYDALSVGTNSYAAQNSYGASTGSNQVKFSTYKIYELPKVGLTPGSSWNVNVANYTYNDEGLAIPPSFGYPDALSVSDITLVSAVWSGNTVIQITSLQSFPGSAEIDVTASPDSTAPFGNDIDEERILVYSNLMNFSTFSVANDTTMWSPLEPAPGRTEMASQNWLSSYTDSAGTLANGVWQFIFADSSSGIKSTPAVSTWIPMSSGQWYTVRMRMVADTPNNSHQSLVYGYNNYVGAGLQADIAANVLFGIPTVWTWQETPLLVHGNSTGGYPQFQFKSSTAGSIYVDEIQVINAAPILVDANRSDTRMNYSYGNFIGGNSTTGWGQEIYSGAGSAPQLSVFENTLQLDFSGTGSGTLQQGIKWTANNGISGHGAATFSVSTGREMGVRATVFILQGDFDSLGIILVAAYGVQTSGQQNIGIPPNNLIAAAGVGVLPGGDYRAVGTAVNPYYQFQFGLRSDLDGIISVSNVDMDIDNNDPNFGDPTLYP